MAPETVTGDIEPDHRIDLYALGAVGYFLLTGEHLFEGRTAVEVCLAHVQKDPVPPSERLGAPTHPGLAALLLACLEKKPSRRPASARELVARLDALDGIEPWDGAEWWEELGALVHRRTEPPKDPSVRTIAADRGR